MIETLTLAYGSYMVSSVMHHKLLYSVLRAPMAFFDTTPLGRIMNRFAKDMDVVDTKIPFTVRMFMFAIAPFLSTIVVVCYTTPIFVLAFLPFVVIFVIIQVCMFWIFFIAVSVSVFLRGWVGYSIWLWTAKNWLGELETVWCHLKIVFIWRPFIVWKFPK